jgi:transcriptional regulator with XRE-family HTH domain
MTETDNKNLTENIGESLKRIRVSRGITLQELSDLSGLSVSFLSLTENNKCGISFSNMQKLLRALNMRIADFLQTTHNDDKVVRLEEASQFGPDIEGVQMFLLTSNVEEKKMEPGLFILEPGASIGYMQHEGEEFAHVIQGSLEVFSNHNGDGTEKRYILHKGDTIYLTSEYLHKYQNISTKQSIFLAAVTPPSF